MRGDSREELHMRKQFVFVCAPLLMIVCSASADTFVLTSPSVVGLDFEGHGFAFFGQGFSIRQSVESSVGLTYTSPHHCCCWAQESLAVSRDAVTEDGSAAL